MPQIIKLQRADETQTDKFLALIRTFSPVPVALSGIGELDSVVGTFERIWLDPRGVLMGSVVWADDFTAPKFFFSGFLRTSEEYPRMKWASITTEPLRMDPHGIAMIAVQRD